MIREGRMQAKVAVSAPGMPAMCRPTNVAALMAMGPGVISAIVVRSRKVWGVSQACTSTTCWRISGMAA